MYTDLSLDDLTKNVLEEIRDFGLGAATQRYYRQAYARLEDFAASRGEERFSSRLCEEFLRHIEGSFDRGTLCHSRRQVFRRASLLLKEFAATGRIDWKPYTFHHQPMPSSEQFVMWLSNFIDSLRCRGCSVNTIQSAKNSVRQFLLFLEDCGMSTLAMASPSTVPLFFQHLLATYRPTSIRTPASYVRSFLRFVEDGQRLLSAVPSHCARNHPIIPILSDKELDVLKSTLQTGKLSARDTAVILLALRTGLRAVDIVKLNLREIDWINDSIAIVQSKTGKPLRIPLTADVGNALTVYILNERPKSDSPRVFLRSVAPYRQLEDHSACYALLRRAFEQAGLRRGGERKGTHLLRHTAASRMLSNGVAVTTISSLLGHSKISSTDIYLSTDEAHMRACALGIRDFPLNIRGLK